MRVNESFSTVQGEGPSTGKRAVFLRLSGCNLDCAWCDTPYTWDWSGKNGVAYDREKETRILSPDVVAFGMLPELKKGINLLVITGGEPLLQQHALIEMILTLREHGWTGRIEIETNGTRIPTPELVGRVYFNVSPKLAHSGVDRDRAIKVPVLQTFAMSRGIFKFVAQTTDDLDEIAGIVEEVGNIHDHQVWVMPEGRTADDVLDGMTKLAQGVLDRGWNLSPRLHVILWGDARGR